MSIAIESVQVYINQFLQNFAYLDAVFLAERVCAEGNTFETGFFLSKKFSSASSSTSVKNDQSIYLLARTYYAAGDVNKSYWLLRNSSIEHLPAAKLLLARCCFDTDK